MKLTDTRLKEVLFYSPETGLFTWLVSRGGKHIGDVAGYLKGDDGYIRIFIDGESFLAHRLSFLFMEGYFPENEVDHINRVRDDNKWVNLREVSKSCNLRNCKVSRNNKSRVNGVCWNKSKSKWVAQIQANGEVTYLGQYSTVLEAAQARYEAEVEFNYLTCKTESSALKYIKACAVNPNQVAS